MMRVSQLPGEFMELKAGDRAEKIGGSYQASGTIVSAFRTKAGALRYVFEFDSPRGMLHIFGPEQVRLIPDGCEPVR